MIPTSPDDKDFPWWLVAVVAIGAYLFWQVLTVETYAKVLTTLQKGIWVTIYVTLVSYSMACLLGLLLALAGMSKSLILRQVSRFYIEVVRGIPIIVLLLYVAFVLAPAMVVAWNWVADLIGLDPIRTRDFSLLWRAVIALTIAYSSFLAEVFRAGLQGVDKGQIEAAEAHDPAAFGQ